MRPRRRQPARLCRPWDSPGKNTGVGCHFLLQCMKVKSESESLSRVRVLATPWTAAHQAPPSLGFPRQERWSGGHCLLRGKGTLGLDFLLHFSISLKLRRQVSYLKKIAMWKEGNKLFQQTVHPVQWASAGAEPAEGKRGAGT